MAGLTQKALAELLAGQSLNADLIERIKACLTTAEMGRYSPEAGDPEHADHLLKDVSNLIDELDKTL